MRPSSPFRAALVAAAAALAAALASVVPGLPSHEVPDFAARDAFADGGPPRATAPGACRSCHVETCERWERSAHALSVQAASVRTVPPEVAAEQEVEHAPGTSAFHRVGDAFTVDTVGDGGAVRTYPVAWIVGVRRMHMLVAPMEDGRLQVLPAMHEVAGPWFDYTHLLFGADNTARGPAPVVAPGEPSFWTGPDRSFDARCTKCHVSGAVVTAPAAGTGGANGPGGATGLRSVWRAPGVDCVACHGDGAAHTAHWRKTGADRKSDPMPDLAKLDRGPSMAVCLPCHLEGEVLDARETADPLDRVEPTLLDDLIRTDAQARPRELMYEGLAFLTSTCAERGKLTCHSCHAVHGSDASFSLKVPPARDGELCRACHAALVATPAEHAHHKADGTGARCTACHMPPLPVERGHGAVRDHSIGVPRPAGVDAKGPDANPDADAAAGSGRAQDACTWCHSGGRNAPRDVPRLDAARLAAAYATWWPGAKVRPWWTAAIDAARRDDEESADDLVAIARDPGAPRLVRASALRLLVNFPGAADRDLLSMTSDRDPLLRREALAGLASVRSDDADAAFVAACADPVPAVRYLAARSALQGWDRVRASKPLLAAVLPVLAEDAAAVPEDHLRWFRLGAARQIAGDTAGAIEAYERKLALDPGAQAVRETVARLRAKSRPR